MAKPNPVVQQNPNWQRTVLLAPDFKNSVIAEIDAGNPNRIAYSPYGQQSAQLELMTRLGFNGELREANTEWYLLGNGYRAYNPRLLRFHSPDSLSPFDRGGRNAYVYCGGEPVMSSDPTGHFFGFISWGFGKFSDETVRNFVFGHNMLKRSMYADQEENGLGGQTRASFDPEGAD
ncbi:RHS repeat-associated core domain-containing protein [Pseudomonas sp. PCH199]|uniref:RHS repeat-associated core domain-containing protein n=1 Tax=unclassified Pseudomonas TaxID=196821 RepID=UPI000BD80678|nr:MULTISPECIES: RHS repeat-associated core domain-containing protein [unclassified Pseudomonas]MCW8276071.1 RHS repeat-associated core domain-containing protein [Pseudomonas sp. PCH199]PAM83465.1 hypothetical protein CES87_10760 [Pseudomonas sp. ERMR1:02]